MKKIISILFSCLYLTIVVGVRLNVHYCSGQIDSINLFSVDGNCCCNNIDNYNNCCKERTFFTQFNKWQQVHQNLRFSFNKYVIVGIVNKVNHSNQHKNIEQDVQLGYFNFPLPPKLLIWLHNCSLVFYG